MCILYVNHRKVNRTIIMSLFKLYIMIFKLWLRAGPSWQHHRPLSKAVHGVTTYTTTRRNKNTHDNFKLMKIKYILCIKFSIRTRCSLQYAMLTYFSIQWIFIQLIELLGTHKKLQIIKILFNIYKAVIKETKKMKITKY
jgi:hypothetical protein